MNNATTADQMRNYLSMKYDLKFEIFAFLPGKKGFNDYFNENVLVAHMPDTANGFVNVREAMGNLGNFCDDYDCEILTQRIGQEFDFTCINRRHIGKMYLAIPYGTYSVQELQKIPLTEITMRDDSFMSCYMAIDGYEDEGLMITLYDVYLKMQQYGASNIHIKVGFVADALYYEKYVMNNRLFGINHWEQFAENGVVHSYLNILEKNMDFNMFREKMIVTRR